MKSKDKEESADSAVYLELVNSISALLADAWKEAQKEDGYDYANWFVRNSSEVRRIAFELAKRKEDPFEWNEYAEGFISLYGEPDPPKD